MKSHGQSKTRLYNTWTNIKQRCLNTKNPRSKHYGHRGISICKEWADSYESFRDWANANGYSDQLTIDRIDVNGDYEPINCRWVTNRDQQLNKRNNRLIVYDDKEKTITEWAQIKGLNIKTIEGRLRDGWTIEDSLNTQLIPKIKDLTNMRFGRLTVVSMSKITNSKVVWTCKCDCGNIKNILSYSLHSGATKSCGCLHRESTFKNRHLSNIAKEKSKSIIIEQIDSNGSVIAEYLGYAEASIISGIHKSCIQRSVKTGKNKAGGFNWRLKI